MTRQTDMKLMMMLDIQSMQARDSLPYTLCITADYFYMHMVCSDSSDCTDKTNQCIKISRRTHLITSIHWGDYQQEVNQRAFTQVIKFALLLGTIVVNQQPYLLIASGAQNIATYIEHPIYIITEIQSFSFRHKLHQRASEVNEENKVLLQIRYNLIPGQMYFSYKENITDALISQQPNTPRVNFNEFAWNGSMMKQYLSARIKSCWTVPVIQGFVAQIKVDNRYFQAQYLTISRRSTKMSGTRFNSRGLNDQAHASNFVQTEDILKCHNYLYVHLSIRGSVPLLWRQENVREPIVFRKEDHNNQELLMQKHYATLQSKYGTQLRTVNLLSSYKSPQKELKNRFEAVHSRSIKSPYLFFDLNFQMEDKNYGQSRISQFIVSNQQLLVGSMPCLILQGITKQVKATQTGIPRVNCLDCLDRTNVILARISENFLHRTVDFINTGADIPEKQIVLGKEFWEKFIEIWAELGDQISFIYCGTESVASHMTRKKNNSMRSFLGGALTSLNRYINAHTNDLFKQECIDTLLGNRGDYSLTRYFEQNILAENIPAQLYSKLSPISMTVITFNTMNCSFPSPSLSDFLTPVITQKPQILVIHLQRVSGHHMWVDCIGEAIKGFDYGLCFYRYMEKEDLLSLYYKKGQKIQCKLVQSVQINIKSSGALAVFLTIQNSVLCFINCKFSSSYESSDQRLKDFNKMHEKILEETYHSRIFKLCQTVFIAGDLNLRLTYHIDKPFKFKNAIEQMYSPLRDKALPQQLFAYDQLKMLRASNFFQYQQASRVTFPPTYKLNKKGVYDKGKYPAWCDRILYSVKQGTSQQRKDSEVETVTCKKYNQIQENLGATHKGVFAYFIIEVAQEDATEKERLCKSYIENHSNEQQ